MDTEDKSPVGVFLRNNPSSQRAQEYNDTENEYIEISNPWGDESLSIIIPQNDAGFDDVLNNIYLPERLSAIWHIDTKRLEIIYTVLPKNNTSDSKDRQFEITHRGLKISCKFAESSGRLLSLASNLDLRSGPTETNFRNLQTYYFYMITQTEVDVPSGMQERFSEATPLSFWIDGLSYDEESIIDFAMHLNFHMNYYDSRTPRVIIHASKNEAEEEQTADRYIIGEFPASIDCQSIDRNLLHFWDASMSGDPARRFLYNYQIIEYASFYIIDDDISRNIKRILSSPHAVSQRDSTVEKIVETLTLGKMQDIQKIDHLFKRCVDAGIVWRQIEANRGSFCEPTTFDGGFQLSAVIQKNWKRSDFETNWIPALPTTLRNMRNALSHGREHRMASVITPTQENLRKLRAWVPVISAIAREVMIYRRAV